ncbi:hypothetical protein O1611_g5898 [Lasiodiplodia mahajangana]|uniref:Uncharacterized protein n=1 Tax=Lasiodiplodia mahajangana TaxID=1108764 RepID=A0ACC2JK29_9PEZI|nr:hypothetical protein O1611_g5898 [Lasiodiplodia mahajangana]
MASASAPLSLSLSTLPTTVASDRRASQDEPTIRFTNVKELLQAINRVPGDYLVVIDVSPSDYEEINRQERRPFRIRRYYANTGILIITIPTHLHEALHLQLYRRYDHKLVRNGQEDSWAPIGSTTFRPQGHPGGDSGEGDSSGGPKPARNYKGAWPTLVIEAGDSESLGALRDDMRWWFSASDHQVNIVLLTKFDHPNQKIIIERWEEELQTREGATTTHQSAASPVFTPTLQQTITITQNTATNPVSYCVTRGALVLSFRLLFLRNPEPQEGDFVISIEELQAYARDIWVLV